MDGESFGTFLATKKQQQRPIFTGKLTSFSFPRLSPRVFFLERPAGLLSEAPLESQKGFSHLLEAEGGPGP